MSRIPAGSPVIWTQRNGWRAMGRVVRHVETPVGFVYLLELAGGRRAEAPPGEVKRVRGAVPGGKR